MNRAWPYGLFVAAILGVSSSSNAHTASTSARWAPSLAMPSTFRWFGLKRKQDCNSCKACAVGCGAQAIDAADGRIDHRECLHCLDCMVLYTDTSVGCPPLGNATPREGMAWRSRPSAPTATSFQSIPRPVSPSRSAPRPLKDPTCACPSSHAARTQRTARGLQWLWLELRDHLWALGVHGWRSQRALQIAGLSLAVAATVAWLMTAMGTLSSGAIIGWWFGWSVYEVLIRLSGKRYVRTACGGATITALLVMPDMVSYAAFQEPDDRCCAIPGIQVHGMAGAMKGVLLSLARAVTLGWLVTQYAGAARSLSSQGRTCKPPWPLQRLATSSGAARQLPRQPADRQNPSRCAA